MIRSLQSIFHAVFNPYTNSQQSIFNFISAIQFHIIAI